MNHAAGTLVLCAVLNASCANPCLPQELSSCLVGATFADCGGSDSRAYCAERGSCLWISNGCPAGGYSIPFSNKCECAGGLCAEGLYAFLYAYGPNEWNRQRAMTVKVVVDPNLGTPQDGPLSCSSAAPCSAIADPDTQRTRLFPGTFSERFRGAARKIVFAGWNLELEIDVAVDPPTARACKIPFTDNLKGCRTAGDPVCADSGEIRVQAVPTAATYQTVKGTMAIHFPDGLTVSGSL